MPNTVNWVNFFSTDAGRTCAEWEIAAFSSVSRTLCGSRAVQLGCPAINALKGCAIAHQILVSTCIPARQTEDIRAMVLASPQSIPLTAECTDLVVWPHGLDCGGDCRQSLAEILRILAPNGLLLVSVLNAAGPWNMKQHLFTGSSVLPETASLITIGKAKSLLTDCGLTLEGGRFGVYSTNPDACPEAPRPINALKPTWLDKAGDRWWPTLGNMAVLVARKRAVGMTLIGKAAFGAKPAHSGKQALAHKEVLSKKQA